MSPFAVLMGELKPWTMSDSLQVVYSAESLTNLDSLIDPDCTGAVQSGFKWLTAAGFPVPQSLRCTYDAKLCYLTITFTLQPGFIAKLPIPDALRNTATVFSYTSRNSTPAHAVALTITDNDTSEQLPSSLPSNSTLNSATPAFKHCLRVFAEAAIRRSSIHGGMRIV